MDMERDRGAPVIEVIGCNIKLLSSLKRCWLLCF